ncbi:MAG: tRNA (N6-isopentenyl adenosine(37)-C2)-methylthiotransferase MiaB [Clostridia bacterium]|nr:tRNA (N6-isopentenyl adenosine(37)-C2)-methylthiotransferase MiaB [Clostridia bacterium]
MTRTAVHVAEEEARRQEEFIREIRELPQRPQTYHVVTYGCQMNAHDSEKIAGMLEEMGLREAPQREEADFVLFNTCCVRENAERRALGNVTWLKEVRKTHPNLMIAVCGCMIQEPGMAEKVLKQYKFIDLAFGTANLHQFPELMYTALNSDRSVVQVAQDDVIAEGLPMRRLRQDAAYLTIMYGCDNFCSFCIVPYVRGRERSRQPEDILQEAEALRDSGVKEIMLLGQNVNSYGKGLEHPMSFAELLKRLDEMGIPRIRFMTSHPKDLSDELIETMAGSPHILPQFHLPVQSGNDEILKRMNRHYTREQYLDRVRKLRQAVPGIGLSTDIIVGFPGETEAQFEDTMSLVREVKYDGAFTFIYSPRVGTRAASMADQVPEEVSSRRIQQLIALQDEIQKETLQRFVGQEEQVLVEGLSRRSQEAVSGKGRHAVSITLPGSMADIGQIVPCRIIGIKNNTLVAERIERNG